MRDVRAGRTFDPWTDLATPSVILDADYRVVFLNRSAEVFWRSSTLEVAGKVAWTALGIEAQDQRDISAWLGDEVFPAMANGEAFGALVVRSDGSTEPVRLRATRFMLGDAAHTVLTTERHAQPMPAPDWACLDPLTGLPNRHVWEREVAFRDAHLGSIVFLDVDRLKQVNDAEGFGRGDALLQTIGRAIRRITPPDSVGVRFGGDEFVILTPEIGGADELGRAIEAAVISETGVAPGNPGHVSYGTAAHRPGHLRWAVGEAQDVLYERRGLLLRSSSGGRIRLTAVRPPILLPGPGAAAKGPGVFAGAFGPEFDAFFRQSFSRAVDEAQEFVEFVNPESGSAVVEVGAGGGRVSFDGGLAARVGAQGQLLLTDPAPAQIAVARARASSLGLDWVRFLVSPAETLPLAANTADLVLGSTFLHFTDEPAAIGAMARILRPGGRLALGAGLESRGGAAWDVGFAPIWAALRERGLQPEDVCLPRDRLEALLVAAGLVLERTRVLPRQTLSYPSAEIAVTMARQTRLAALQARRLPAEMHGEMEARFASGFHDAITRFGVRSADFSAQMVYLVARKPGGR